MKRRLIGPMFAMLALAITTTTSAGLIGYWPLDGDTKDASPNGLDGELIGDTAFSEDVPDALGGGTSLLLNTEFTLDGGLDEATIAAEEIFGYVDLGNPDELNFGTNDFTVAAWMKVPEALFQRGNIFSNGGDNGGGVRYVLGYLENGGQAVVLTTDDNTNKYQAQAPLDEWPVDDEEWHHVVGQREGNELRVYIDGDLAAENFDVVDDYDLSGTSQRNAYIGLGVDSASGTFEKFFQGWVDDVAVWDEALSEEDILTVMSGDFSKWPTNTGGILGDFDNSAALDVADIDLLIAGFGGDDTSFDLTEDGNVDKADLNFWVVDLKNSYIGDANLDGEFNSGDFVTAFTGGKYETGESATWSLGDWNGDGVFNSGDFVDAFSGGGYEQGPRTATAAVPEPSSILLLLSGMLLLARRK